MPADASVHREAARPGLERNALDAVPQDRDVERQVGHVGQRVQQHIRSLFPTQPAHPADHEGVRGDAESVPRGLPLKRRRDRRQGVRHLVDP